MFFKLLSGDIISLEEKEDLSFIKQLETILEVPHFRIHTEIIDESNSIVFIKDHPHKVRKFYGGITDGFLNGEYGQYEEYVICVSRKNNINNEPEWIQHNINYFFEPYQKRFLIKKDIIFKYDESNGECLIMASKSYNTLIDVILNIDQQMESDTISYLLDQVPNL